MYCNGMCVMSKQLSTPIKSVLQRGRQAKNEVFTVSSQETGAGVPVTRCEREDHKVMLGAWTEILVTKMKEDPTASMFPSNGRKADLLSIFDGPSGDLQGGQAPWCGGDATNGCDCGYPVRCNE